MKCEKCNVNNATVYLQQIIDNDKTELHLCKTCHEVNVDSDDSEFISHILDAIAKEILGQISHIAAKKFSLKNATITCSTCGITFEELKKNSNLGCAACYKSFSKPLQELLKETHVGIKHRGKYPKRSGAKLWQLNKIDELRTLLRKAVEDEDYEKAALFRDEIRELDSPVQEVEH